MAKVNLTAGRIREFVTDKPQAFLWDAAAPGLAVRATRSGVKTYVFQGRVGGLPIRCTIGDVLAWSLDEARAEARRLQTLIDRGIDPRQEKKDQAEARRAAELEAKRRELLVSEAWQAYIAARRHKWGVRHLNDHDNVAKTELAPLMSLRLADITPERVRAWLRDEVSRRPTRASLAYRLLRAFLNWCEDSPDYRGIAASGACGSRVAKDVLPRPGRKSDCLQREQLPAWFEVVRRIANPVIAAYLQCLLLTGARRGELMSLRWENVDFRWRSLTIGDKVDGERVIPLTPYVAWLLSRLPRRNEWVFSSPTASSGRLQEPAIQHRRACAAAGIEGLTLNGLRRSFATLSEWVEAPVGVVAQIQGHKPSATAEKHYKRRPLDLLRMWHGRIETWMLEQAGIPLPEEGSEGLRLVADNSKKAIL
ncbi:MAG: integrase family protein [Rhodocyclaceae bacterium]|nr:integrase family protein [Rhodocyclaceae bacterium]